MAEETANLWERMQLWRELRARDHDVGWHLPTAEDYQRFLLLDGEGPGQEHNLAEMGYDEPGATIMLDTSDPAVGLEWHRTLEHLSDRLDALEARDREREHERHHEQGMSY
jgi:hypothetical protein